MTLVQVFQEVFLSLLLAALEINCLCHHPESGAPAVVKAGRALTSSPLLPALRDPWPPSVL